MRGRTSSPLTTIAGAPNSRRCTARAPAGRPRRPGRAAPGRAHARASRCRARRRSGARRRPGSRPAPEAGGGWSRGGGCGAAPGRPRGRQPARCPRATRPPRGRRPQSAAPGSDLRPASVAPRSAGARAPQRPRPAAERDPYQMSSGSATKPVARAAGRRSRRRAPRGVRVAFQPQLQFRLHHEAQHVVDQRAAGADQLARARSARARVIGGAGRSGSRRRRSRAARPRPSSPILGLIELQRLLGVPGHAQGADPPGGRDRRRSNRDVGVARERDSRPWE